MRNGGVFAAVAIVLIGLCLHPMPIESGDEPHYHAIAHSIAFDGDLDVSNNYGAAEPLISDGNPQPATHARPGRGGVLRPVHDVGFPLVLAPIVRAAVPAVTWIAPKIPASAAERLRLTPRSLYRRLLQTVLALFGAAMACVLRGCLLRAGAAAAEAAWIAVLVAVSPPLLIHSVLLYTEILSAMLCLLAFRTLAMEASPSPRALAWAGAAAGFLSIVHARNVGLVAGLCAVWWLSRKRPVDVRPAAAFVVPVIVMLGVRSALNYHLWGSWISNPHAAPGAWHGAAALAGTAAVRLAGMLVDQEFGLLPYAPFLLIAAGGLFASARAGRPLAWRIAVVVGAYVLPILLTITNAHGWRGGWSPAGRFLVPIVPLLALGFVAGLRAIPRPIVVAVLVLQVALDAWFWQHPLDLWNDGDGRAAICERANSSCGFLPSLPAD